MIVIIVNSCIQLLFKTLKRPHSQTNPKNKQKSQHNYEQHEIQFFGTILPAK